MKVQSDRPAAGDGGGWLHPIPGAADNRRNGHHVPATPMQRSRKAKADPAPIHAWCREALTPELLIEFAELIGVEATAADEFGLGWHPGEHCWTLPMFDANGELIGLQRRWRPGEVPHHVEGNKATLKDTRNGVFRRRPDLPPDDGLLAITEGGSDAIAVRSFGECDAIGICNAGGTVKMAANYAHRRDVLVFGDADEAGRASVSKVVAAVRGKAKSVRVVFPPAPHKDARSWRSGGATWKDVLDAADSIDVEALREATDERAAIQAEDGDTGAANGDPLILDPKRTLPTAEQFVQQHHSHEDGRTLHAHAGSFWKWRCNRYALLDDAALRHQLQPWLHAAAFYDPRDDNRLKPYPANNRAIGDALAAVRDLVHLDSEMQTPAWLGEGEPPAPLLDLISCRSAILNVPTRALLPATPRLFCTAAIDFDPDPEAPVPQHWIKFLGDLFGDDVDALELLQDWFGYSLTTDTGQQKALLLVGPRRSGKGTILRVLRELIGPANVVAPTVSSLAEQFGLQPLIGKSLAMISDARFAGEGVATVVERLLTITGEDAVSVNRKHRDAVTLTLPTRFTVATNELPRLPDSAAALAGRFVTIMLRQSFFGREDHGLTRRLLGELPSILNWSLDGLDRLRRRGRFQEPRSSREAQQDIEDLSSPVGAFLRERCIVEPGRRALCDALFAAWRGWCEADGRTGVGTKQTFGRNLAAAAPGVTRRRGTGDMPFYEGVDLR